MMLPGPAGFWPFPSEQGVCSAACSRWLAGHPGVRHQTQTVRLLTRCCGRVPVPSPLCMPGARCGSPCPGVVGADGAALCLPQVWVPARQREAARGRCR